MADQVPLMCGVYRLQLANNSYTRPMRLHADDVAGETIPHGPSRSQPIAPGCYQAGEEAIEHFTPKIEARLRKTPAIDDNGHAVFVDDKGQRVHDGTGRRRMVLEPGDKMSLQLLL